MLAPELRPGDLVVMDNLAAHKVAGVARGDRGPRRRAALPAALLPDLNPIEQAFAKLKALLRKAAERTVDGLWNAIGKLLDLFPPAECANYLANSGYPRSKNVLQYCLAVTFYYNSLLNIIRSSINSSTQAA